MNELMFRDNKNNLNDYLFICLSIMMSLIYE